MKATVRRRGRGRGTETSLFYASDVHGSELCFRKFLGAKRFYEVDTIIMGGDLTGKLIVPIVQASGNSYHAFVQGAVRAVPTGELEELERQVRFNGQYPYRCTAEEYARLNADDAQRSEVFTGLMVEQVRRWVALSEETLPEEGACFIMPGNDDELALDAALEGSATVVNPDSRVVRLGELQMLSCSWVNPTPWHSPREETEEALLDRLESIATDLVPGLPTIFNLHSPPYGTMLDRAPKLNDRLEVEMRGAEMVFAPCGSRAVRTFIERHQPILALHGHIHESRATEKIGATLCVNPGSKYAEGVIDGAIVKFTGDQVHSCQLVTG